MSDDGQAKRLERELREDLARRLEAAQGDVVLLALHIGCGAVALGIRGRVDPAVVRAEG